MIGRDILRPLLQDHSRIESKILKCKSVAFFFFLAAACLLGVLAWINFLSKRNRGHSLEASVSGLQFWQSVDPVIIRSLIVNVLAGQNMGKNVRELTIRLNGAMLTQ